MIQKKDLYEWCRIPIGDLTNYPTKIPFRIIEDSKEMGYLMARELVNDIKAAANDGRMFRAIIPCGPKGWYEPYTRMINEEHVSLHHVVVFHMDECLDWQGQLLPEGDPYNFRSFMEKYFYGGIDEGLAVPREQRYFLTPKSMDLIREEIAKEPIDLTIGGFGQDGHVAYNQARRHPYSHITVDDVRKSTIRIQENNIDTMIALSQRTYGGAYQFVPPMSMTLGVKECLSAKAVRVYSDTGAWKQTAFRVALFSDETEDYPMTLMQNHPNALITVTKETARHPISENQEWQFRGVNV